VILIPGQLDRLEGDWVELIKHVIVEVNNERRDKTY
jgi:hypothetical protein